MNKELSKLKLFSYSLFAIPLAILGLPLYIYLPTFYAKDVGIDMALVGATLLIARVIDVFTDPIIGRLSDKYFKRYIFIIIGSILVLFSFYFLTHPISNANAFYLFIFSVLIYTGWSLLTIPYFSLSAEISFNKNHNNLLASSREFFTIIAVVLALFLPYYFNISKDEQKSLLLMWELVLYLLPILLIFLVFGTKNTQKIDADITIKESFVFLKKNSFKFRKLFFAFFINNIANAIPATLFILFVTYVINEKDSIGVLLLVYFLSGVLALPFWYYISKRFGKKNSWIYSIILASLVFLYVPFLSEGDFVPFLIVCIISGFSLGADMFLPSSIQADIAQDFTKQNSQFTGVLFSFWAMLTKLALASAVGITFIILGVFGFDSNPQSSTSQLLLSSLYSLLPIVLKLLAVVFILKSKHLEY
ncbi:MFS transporter [Malaciobacter canalis]|uniref:MFS transporter n=1 Tax=Malaciobacter canalis TaxID=1912871 RepID=A0ABX4LP71_9BACT|nr:MFS transporter [Malaciobacter canalis]PHO09385.1 MFS transporter [Malaciobacter canalis]QEE32199.1 major facilitator superfamily transporter [Malaciobacter canalis]